MRELNLILLDTQLAIPRKSTGIGIGSSIRVCKQYFFLYYDQLHPIVAVQWGYHVGALGKALF